VLVLAVLCTNHKQRAALFSLSLLYLNTTVVTTATAAEATVVQPLYRHQLRCCPNSYSSTQTLLRYCYLTLTILRSTQTVVAGAKSASGTAIVQKGKFTPRSIVHPVFRNVTFQDAETALKEAGITGEVSISIALHYIIVLYSTL
jgi:hypothetical protein